MVKLAKVRMAKAIIRNEPDHQHVKFSSLSWAVLIGAAIGVLAYWLVVEVWAPGKFYSDQQVISRPVGALVQTEVPNQLSWSSSANKFVNAVCQGWRPCQVKSSTNPADRSAAALDPMGLSNKIVGQHAPRLLLLG